jgi:hypothetical protein
MGAHDRQNVGLTLFRVGGQTRWATRGMAHDRGIQKILVLLVSGRSGYGKSLKKYAKIGQNIFFRPMDGVSAYSRMILLN